MQKVHLRMVLSMPLAFCLCANLAAQRAIQSMKLLTPEVGWTATKEKLFWTTSGGARWKDITPKLDHKWQAISSVAFLDPSTGWILLNCADNRDEKADDTCFEFASTANAGETWSVVHPKIVDPVANDSGVEDGLGFSGRSFLQFADSQHGWAILKKSTPVDFSTGVKLRTADGGQTWTQLKGDLPMAEDFHFGCRSPIRCARHEKDFFLLGASSSVWDYRLISRPAKDAHRKSELCLGRVTRSGVWSSENSSGVYAATA
jgi:hypothetical protein